MIILHFHKGSLLIVWSSRASRYDKIWQDMTWQGTIWQGMTYRSRYDKSGTVLERMTKFIYPLCLIHMNFATWFHLISLDHVWWYCRWPRREWEFIIWRNCAGKQKAVQMLHLPPFVVLKAKKLISLAVSSRQVGPARVRFFLRVE